MDDNEFVESDLEEVEPEAWPLDLVDESIEGVEGYIEGVDEDDDSVDSVDSETDISS